MGGVLLLLGVLLPPFTDPVNVLLEGLGEVDGERLVPLVLRVALLLLLGDFASLDCDGEGDTDVVGDNDGDNDGDGVRDDDGALGDVDDGDGCDGDEDGRDDGERNAVGDGEGEGVFAASLGASTFLGLGDAIVAADGDGDSDTWPDTGDGECSALPTSGNGVAAERGLGLVRGAAAAELGTAGLGPWVRLGLGIRLGLRIRPGLGVGFALAGEGASNALGDGDGVNVLVTFSTVTAAVCGEGVNGGGAGAGDDRLSFVGDGDSEGGEGVVFRAVIFAEVPFVVPSVLLRLRLRVSLLLV